MKIQTQSSIESDATLAKRFPRRFSRAKAAIAGLSALVVGASALILAPAASADTVPPSPTTPATVSADALPTVQIDGVVWQQLVVGNTVYAVGKFAKARPAGSAPGQNTVTRNNILAYDIRTGVLNTNFSPSLNAQALSLAISPDQKRLYVGGDFTQANGKAVSRLVALDPTTGALDSTFAPKVGATVKTIVATAGTIYSGGEFTSVGSASRPRLAAFNAKDGALLPWNPKAVGGPVEAMVMSPDGGKLVVGGGFVTLNGAGNPGYGLGAVSAADGSSLPFAANTLIRNGGPNASILTLSSDGNQIYGAGFVFGSGGNLEGVFAADWNTGKLNWVADCHGDTYSVYPSSTAVYAASHQHYCGNIGGFPQTNPWTFSRATAFSKNATGTVTADPHGYYNYAGNPRPDLLNWFPELNVGTVTGQNQGPWSVAGNSQYIVMGGEFTTANRTGQQGLVRFAASNIAPNKQGPMVAGKDWKVETVSQTSGAIRVTWPANWDRDNERITYKLIRDGNENAPIYSVAANSTFWDRPIQSFTDTGLAPGSKHSYQVIATDPFGNTTRSAVIQGSVTTDGVVGPYPSAVISAGATSYWRLDQPFGTSTIFDWNGSNDLTASAGVAGGAQGAMSGDPNTASTFNGQANGFASTRTPVAAPNSFSAGAWIKTTSKNGGKILGFGNSDTGLSSKYDRHISMDNNGKLYFSVYNGVRQYLSTPASYNDGKWHYVVASMGANGINLYVDGQLADKNAAVTSSEVNKGFWRIGGDNLANWLPAVGSNFFNGAIDEVAIFDKPLTLKQIQDQIAASKLEVATADSYGDAVKASAPELYWRLAESGGTVAQDASGNNVTGNYGGKPAFNQATGVEGSNNPAVAFDGSTAYVASQKSYSNPKVYSTAIWFKTTTNRGGNLIGLGGSRDATSSTYDRQIFMENSGQLTFGTWTTGANAAKTSKAFNDGAWHMAVATQGADGMKLYVDGALVASNSQTQAQNVNGYWKVGAERSWTAQPYFAGTLDEASVYLRVLSEPDVVKLYQAGSGSKGVKKAPIALFSSSGQNLQLNFDASASSDPDGSVASYAWDFGDGTTATGVKTEHSYEKPGNYQVRLTVIDNDGLSSTTLQTVSAIGAPNVAPIAKFSTITKNLTATFNASASSDPDGTIASYEWDFGDGNRASGKEVTRNYNAAGVYQVTLSVQDDRGLVSTQTQAVTVSAPVVATLASDTFARTAANGWGASEKGGNWSVTGSAANYNVSGGQGSFLHASSGVQRRASLSSVSSVNTDVQITASFDKLVNGGGSYVTVIGRQITASDDYRAKVQIDANGAVYLHVGKSVAGAETTLVTRAIPGLSYSPGKQLNIRIEVTGTGSSKINASVWEKGANQPGWQVSASDNTQQLQNPGAVSVMTYISGSASNVPVTARFDDLLVKAPIG